ncbi:MAG: hypothetical protein K6T34_06290 [Thermoflavifilum sp.]|nr:hypothetical protein [Thermoflavifilum sp.]
MEKVMGGNPSGSADTEAKPTSTHNQPKTNPVPDQNNTTDDQEIQYQQPSPPEPIHFPVTGETVQAIHFIYQIVFFF